MNKLILRLKFINTNEVVEVIVDTRLTFIENLKLLKEIVDINESVEIYDPNNRCFVSKEIEIAKFGYINFYELSIY